MFSPAWAVSLERKSSLKTTNLLRARFELAALCLVCLVFVVGCGAKQIPIEGAITLDDEPLDSVQILLDQPDVDGGNSFAGKTDEEGHFVLHSVGGEPTEEVAGKYRVSLTTAVAPLDATEHDPLPPERIPKHYRDGTLSFTVPEGGTDQANFELTKRKKK